uniref:HTH deoR-type domain-containing protein n=1 Tax=Thermofilum adornatum TaxID=1365176 RepID=A0A7C1CBY9_9CREN
MDKTESETLEFKRSLSDFDSILATISAFANTRGGRILIGVDDDGKVVGVYIGKGTLEELVNKISQNTQPKIYPEIKVSNINGKQIIEIIVTERSDKPVFAKGIAYKRVGKSNVKMDRDEILNLLRKTYEVSYEDAEAAPLEAIDTEKVETFIARARETRLIHPPQDTATVLKNLGLTDSKASLAAVLLFGKNPQAYAPWAVIKIGKFTSEHERPLYEKEIVGVLVEQIEKSYAEVLSLIRKEIVVEKPARKEIYEYPPEAIRELIVNAVAHRDYSIKSPIYIKIYPDKLTIENPGGLPPGITIEDLKKPHTSILRNPKIANTLYILGYIEKWGIGTLTVIKKCIQNGNGEPTFQTNHTFKAEIKSRYITSTDNREQLIIQYLATKKQATRREIEKLLGLKESTVRKILENMQNKGLITKQGTGKKTTYKLNI